jgi:hypothetical protein
LIALAVLVTPMLAPEHVHEPDAHHDRAVVHRHVEAHQHDAASIEDNDGPVVWVSFVGTVADIAPSVPPVIAVRRFELTPTLQRVAAPDQFTLEAAHGPPRSPDLSRAPPAAV